MSVLAGRTIVVTRETGQAAGLSDALRSRGARVIESPVIGFEDPPDWRPADAAIASLAAYQRLLFTSANAVDRFARRLAARGLSGDALKERMRGVFVTAIGPATAAAARSVIDLPVDEVPSDYRAEGMVRHLEEQGPLAGSRVLLPRAEVAREVLPEALRARGAVVDVVPVYRAVPRPVTEEVKRLLAGGAVDVVTFTSAGTVQHFLAGLAAGLPERVVVAVIGPVTAAAARALGIEPAIVAPRSTMQDLAEAIASYYDATHPTR